MKKVALHMDISAPYLSHLERGIRNVTPELQSRFYKAMRK